MSSNHPTQADFYREAKISQITFRTYLNLLKPFVEKKRVGNILFISEL